MLQKQLKEFSSEKIEGQAIREIALIFIVVTKRINTRMFANNNNRLSNPLPGTVMDKTVTLPHWSVLIPNIISCVKYISYH